MRTLALTLAALTLGGSPVRIEERKAKTLYVLPDPNLERVCFDQDCITEAWRARPVGGWRGRGDLACPNWPSIGSSIVPTDGQIISR